MRSAILALFLSTLIAVPQLAHAQGPGPKDALNFVEQELIRTHFSLFRGMVLKKGNKELDLGFFGQNYDVVFRGSPKAVELGKSYMGFKISGWLLTLAGLSLLVTDIILLGVEAKAAIDKSRSGAKSVKPLGWILLGVGAGVGLTGAILVGVSNVRLMDAVNAYNRDVFEQSRRRFSFGITPLRDGVAAQVGYAF